MSDDNRTKSIADVVNHNLRVFTEVPATGIKIQKKFMDPKDIKSLAGHLLVRYSTETGEIGAHENDYSEVIVEDGYNIDIEGGFKSIVEFAEYVQDNEVKPVMVILPDTLHRVGENDYGHFGTAPGDNILNSTVDLINMMDEDL